MKKEFDKGLSALILLTLAVMWSVSLIVTYCNVPVDVTYGLRITRDVIQCLMILVVLYNALGWSSNFIVKIVFIAIALFSIFCTVFQYIPGFEKLLAGGFPAGLLEV